SQLIRRIPLIPVSICLVSLSPSSSDLNTGRSPGHHFAQCAGDNRPPGNPHGAAVSTDRRRLRGGQRLELVQGFADGVGEVVLVGFVDPALERGSENRDRDLGGEASGWAVDA